MDVARYFLAVLVLVTFPPALLYWFLIHPLAGHWRRLGPGWTYTVITVAGLLLGVAIFQFRQPLVRVEYGFQPALAWLALACYLASIALEVLCRRHLKLRVLTGVPEVSGQSYPGKLLTEGIYGRVRHPRYLSATLGLLAVALFTNYLAVWVLLAGTVPALYGVVLLEEKELRERFGEEYDRYSREVPRLIPRLGGRPVSQGK